MEAFAPNPGEHKALGERKIDASSWQIEIA
jgi:hypothetical protein